MLILDDEKYYLVAYDIDEKIFKHYRLDKMRDVSESVKKRNGLQEAGQIEVHPVALPHVRR